MPLSDVLAHAPRAAAIVRRAEQMNALTTMVRRALPDELRPGLAAVNLRDDTLVLVTPTAAWANRLRYHGAEILTKLAAGQAAGVSRIAVKVRQI